MFGLVRTAETGVGEEKLPVTGWTVSVDGAVVVAGRRRGHLDLVVDGEAEEGARVRVDRLQDVAGGDIDLPDVARGGVAGPERGAARVDG